MEQHFEPIYAYGSDVINMILCHYLQSKQLKKYHPNAMVLQCILISSFPQNRPAFW